MDSPYWTKLAGTHLDKDAPPGLASYLLFADPWSPVENVMTALGCDAVIAGGISVPTGVGPTVAIDNRPLPQGSLLGVCFKSSALKLQVVVAQGCRPVEGPVPYWTVTATQGSCVLELDGQPALSVLQNLISSIQDTKEQTSISSGLVCGIQAEQHINNNNNSDDYLIRQILGFVPSKDGIAVAGAVGKGDRLRFYVRDPRAASEDLHLMVQRARTERTVFRDILLGDSQAPVAAIQISCIARGRSLFGVPNVDLTGTMSFWDCATDAADGESTIGGSRNLPVVGGFYANGEIGPVGIAGFSAQTPPGSGSGTYLHGFTTVIAYICDTSKAASEQNNIPPNPTLIDEPENVWG